MLNQLRKRLMERIEVFFTSSRTFFLPTDKKGTRLTRYRVKQSGWIWYLFPRYILEKMETIDIVDNTKSALITLAKQFNAVVDNSRSEVVAYITKAVRTKAVQVEKQSVEKVSKLVLGTAKLPSSIAIQGRAALQAAHRSLIETAGHVAAEKYDSALRKTLAQLLGYAREEAGVSAKTDSHALPLGSRFVFHGGNLTLYIVEEAPRVRTILWDGVKERLSFPFVIFAVYLINDKYFATQVFVRKVPLQSEDDMFSVPPLPDIMEIRQDSERKLPSLEHYVCFNGPKKLEGSHASIVEATQQEFWGSNFLTTHWGASLYSLVKKVPPLSLSNWRALSATNPTSCLSMPWIETDISVKSLGIAVKSYAKTSTIQQGLTNLERYTRDLSQRFAVQIQEAVVDELEALDSVAIARTVFDEKIKLAIEESLVGEEVRKLVQAHLLYACSVIEVEKIVSTAAQKANDQLRTTIVSAQEVLLTSVSKSLGELAAEPTNQDEGEGYD